MKKAETLISKFGTYVMNNKNSIPKLGLGTYTVTAQSL